MNLKQYFDFYLQYIHNAESCIQNNLTSALEYITTMESPLNISWFESSSHLVLKYVSITPAFESIST
jgi:hypothetical protein